ncbi:MAG: DUF4493 domain-containing protein [Bacteroidales bacterium]|nr:DUF4493 domain-containing protein [Bacteroidales bacterium]
MKRFAAAGMTSGLLAGVSAAILSSCNIIPDATPQSGATISFSFAEPVKAVVTKSTPQSISVPDTNAFTLAVKSIDGSVIWSGPYGSRPSYIEVEAGTYEISVFSQQFSSPAFDSPIYGDSHTVVVSNGENVSVSFLCRQTNCGVKLNFGEKFIEKYPSGSVLLAHDSGSLRYGYNEDRFAYFEPGNISFGVSENGVEQPLFNKVLAAATMLTINLEASSNTSQGTFSIDLDTDTNDITEDIIVGTSYSGEDGSTSATAFSVGAAQSHVGDTVWVWGYIVGGDCSSTTIKFTAPFEKSSNLAIAETKGETNRDNCFTVELSKAAVKSALNLMDNPGNLGLKVWLKGVVTSSYFGLCGIKSVSEFQLE